MNLLLFFIQQIFSEGHFPTPQEICSGADTIAPMCYTSVGFTLFFTLFVIAVTIFVFLKKYTNNYALITLSILRILACFFLTDQAMEKIEQPVRFGVEWFTLLYYFWCLILINIFFSLLLFPQKKRALIRMAFMITLAFIPVLAYTGRGNFEQITPIAGGLFAKASLDMLWLSFSFRLFVFLAFFAALAASVATAASWAVSGKFDLVHFKRILPFLGTYLMIIALPVLSIPLGEAYNKKDVSEAKNYIDEIKKNVVKYYYENGEYPKFIENMLPPGRSPRLLERHEFFTMGVRGTYYFSRADKFCFIFQNPVRDFGYYSMTSERDWRYNIKGDSYDDAFINLCDESEKNFEDLISNHLGVDPDDQLINELSLEAGAPDMPKPMSKRSSKILEEKIIDEGKKDPAFKKFLETPVNKK